jgi:hypothetical protein
MTRRFRILPFLLAGLFFDISVCLFARWGLDEPPTPVSLPQAGMIFGLTYQNIVLRGVSVWALYVLVQCGNGNHKFGNLEVSAGLAPLGVVIVQAIAPRCVLSVTFFCTPPERGVGAPPPSRPMRVVRDRGRCTLSLPLLVN